MATHAGSPPRSLWPSVAAVLPAITVVLAGIWLAGGILTDDFRISMALTALWFALVGAGAAMAWRRAPVLRPAARSAWLSARLRSVRSDPVDDAAGPIAYE